MSRGTKKQYKCKCCGDVFIARVADRKRGWAKFCSKSCKAKKQMQTHGDTRLIYSTYVDDFDPSWDAHKFGGF